MPRSGTTLLARLLGSCGPYAVLPESHFFSRFVWVSAGHDTLGALRLAWTRFAGSRPWPLQARIGTGWEEAPNGLPPQRYRTVFLEWVAAELDLQGRSPNASSWIENTPAHVEGIPFISRLFPEARIVGLVRDPRAVHASLLEVDWNDATAAANGERWLWYVRRLEKWTRISPQRVRLMRYEDLVRDPVEVLEGLSPWLNVQLEVTEEKLADQTTRGFDAASEPWKAMAARRPDVSRIEGWRNKLTSDQILAVEQQAGAHMARHGYQLATMGHRSAPLRGSWHAMGMYARLWARNVATRIRLMPWDLASGTHGGTYR